MLSANSAMDTLYKRDLLKLHRNMILRGLVCGAFGFLRFFPTHSEREKKKNKKNKSSKEKNSTKIKYSLIRTTTTTTQSPPPKIPNSSIVGSMDNCQNSFLNWACHYQGKSMEELRQSLLLMNMELETTRLRTQEELRFRDEQLVELTEMLKRVVKERDEAQERCQKLIFEKLLLQQFNQKAPLSGVSSVEDEPRRGIDSNNGFSSSDCEESIVSSPVFEPIPPNLLPPPPQSEPELPAVMDRRLPEKGKLLQAVMEAGPLLQTLLLAGPLPQWRHPPPPLDTCQIPPPPLVIPSPAANLLHQDPLPNISICGGIDRKRGIREGSDYSAVMKYQKIMLS